MKTKEEIETEFYDNLLERIYWGNDFDEARKLIKEYVFEMCELQKEECTNNAKTEDSCEVWNCMGENINKNSILNCKNVANEE